MRQWWSNLSQNWRGAFKQGISSISAVVITNIVDPEKFFFSWAALRHMAVAMFFMTLLNEARYWKQWADSPEEGD